MRLLVAITDSKWFDYLAELRPDEVNFWQLSGSGSFRALSPGEPLLFKLHSPNDFIVGGGFFSHYAVLPASFAEVGKSTTCMTAETVPRSSTDTAVGPDT
jgi:putative restriction endonuclease